MHGRAALDGQLAGWLKSLPTDSTLLMYLGAHVGALERAGIPLQRVINEGNHRAWRQPVDPEGLWERALKDPANYADYAIGFDGGQPPATIFQGRTQGRTQERAPVRGHEQTR